MVKAGAQQVGGFARWIVMKRKNETAVLAACFALVCMRQCIADSLCEATPQSNPPAQGNSDISRMWCANANIDLGVSFEPYVTTRFAIHNPDNRPHTLSMWATSCGCTGAIIFDGTRRFELLGSAPPTNLYALDANIRKQVASISVEPNTYLWIDSRIELQGRKGELAIGINTVVDGNQSSMIALRAKVVVGAAFEINPASVAIEASDCVDKHHFTVSVTSTKYPVFKITSTKQPDNVSLDLVGDITNGKTVYIMSGSYNSKGITEKKVDYISFTTDVDARVAAIPIDVTVAPPVLSDPDKVLSLGALHPRSPVGQRVKVRLSSAKDIIVSKVEFWDSTDSKQLNNLFATTIDKSKLGEVSLQFCVGPNATPGPVNAKLKIYVNNDEVASKTIIVNGLIIGPQ